MALPRPSTLHHFLGIAKVSTTTASTTTTASQSQITPAPATSAQANPYRITRTPSNNYPVYTLAKRGGNMKLTKLRRIEGDVNVLRDDLQQALGMDQKEVVINQLTKQIIVKVR
jgi:large subunit ribosomal protein L49